jgi:peptide/nickel transport system permease protein
VHVLPNTLAPLIVVATAQLARPSWWNVKGQARLPGRTRPGAACSSSAAEHAHRALVDLPRHRHQPVVFGTNLFGDALRDLLDPRQRT